MLDVMEIETEMQFIFWNADMFNSIQPDMQFCHCTISKTYTPRFLCQPTTGLGKN